MTFALCIQSLSFSRWRYQRSFWGVHMLVLSDDFCALYPKFIFYVRTASNSLF